jgi:hypothetical protein
VIPVLVKPDLGAIVGLAAVDVEVSVAVGYSRDPILLLTLIRARVEAVLDVPVLPGPVPQRRKLVKTV